MNNFEYWLSYYMFLFSCMMFSFHYKYLMMMVISLEFMMIFLCYNFFILIMKIEVCSNLLMFMLVLSVCESVLVLSLIILIVRLYGNDYIISVNLIKW